MTKAEIIDKIAEETGLAKKDVAISVEAFMESIREVLAEEKENVYRRPPATSLRTPQWLSMLTTSHHSSRLRVSSKE